MKQLCPGEVCIKLKPRRFEVNQWVSESVDLFLCSLLLLRRDRRKCDEQIDQAAGVVWIAIPFVCLQLKTKRPLGHKKKRFPSFVPAGVCTVWVPITVMGWDIFFSPRRPNPTRSKVRFHRFPKLRNEPKWQFKVVASPFCSQSLGVKPFCK